MHDYFEWLQKTIFTELKVKINLKQISEIADFDIKFVACLVDEIQTAIDTYNQHLGLTHVLGFEKKLFKNAGYLEKIWDKPLPDYQSILTKLKSDKKLFTLVFTELRESTYFKEVYEISNPTYLLLNLLILFYRTSLLFLYPILREQRAQISSTLEEMAAAMRLAGNDMQMFHAVRHWILNWQTEDFNPELAKKILVNAT